MAFVVVMPALVAGIHVLRASAAGEDLDGRDKPGHDGRNAAWPPEDGFPSFSAP